MFVNSKNNVGDPVIDQIQNILQSYPHITGILLNCDLSDKVREGSQIPRFNVSLRGLALI